MSEINWKEKLSSRKLWLGVALVVIGVILCATGDVENGLRVITIGGVGYLGAETIVDVARAIWGTASQILTIEDTTEVDIETENFDEAETESFDEDDEELEVEDE